MTYRIRELRCVKGLTQSELARVSGVSVRTIRDMELSDARITTGRTLVRLATALETTIGGLFADDAPSAPTRDGAEARRRLSGTLGEGLVIMSDVQFDDLCARLSLEELHHYFAVIAENERSGRRYKRRTHYRAILDMAENDRKTLKA